MSEAKSCATCKWFEDDQEDGNEGQGKWYQVCRADARISNLPSFPFKATKCRSHEGRG